MIALQGKSQIIQRDETLSLVRAGAVRYIDGKPVASSSEHFDIRGNVQPLNGRDLLLVPEGDQTKEQYWVYTAFRIKLNDRVDRCGVSFQVQGVETWGSFNKARIMRIDIGPNENTCDK